MERRHFAIVARIIKSLHTFGFSVSEVSKIAHCFAGQLRVENSRFDRERFIKACGVEVEP